MGRALRQPPPIRRPARRRTTAKEISTTSAVATTDSGASAETRGTKTDAETSITMGEGNETIHTTRRPAWRRPFLNPMSVPAGIAALYPVIDARASRDDVGCRYEVAYDEHLGKIKYDGDPEDEPRAKRPGLFGLDDDVSIARLLLMSAHDDVRERSATPGESIVEEKDKGLMDVEDVHGPPLPKKASLLGEYDVRVIAKSRKVECANNPDLFEVLVWASLSSTWAWISLSP
ncbi:hypothetical protein CONLIGDRAFT_686825 [Coniochaeta ligniaria NRRL 30616]|uniref:Uncharacterized protein n=1 Tax=Coniochaeta ligniaria NRRL 30616 TaxID=1408157 RepID=A0A1J7J2J8_9PEZI|nr:hypothetical protein CONLIGDRAFT_686825 [Coniochaeta ligniaria NRRL 30616]